MDNFKKWISTRYPGAKIVTLSDLAEKIVGVSKVRVTDKRTITEYDEITLSDIQHGIVTVPRKKNEFGPANESAIKQQSLQRGDLILSKRPRSLTVGLVDTEFERPLVANNGMIRVIFPEDRKINTPIFVAEYLQIPQVKQYLEINASGTGSAPALMNSKVLSKLPIPIFNDNTLQDLVKDIKEKTLLRKEIIAMNRSYEEINNLTNSLIADTLFTSCEKFDTSHILYNLQNINENMELTLQQMRLLNVINS